MLTVSQGSKGIIRFDHANVTFDVFEALESLH